MTYLSTVFQSYLQDCLDVAGSAMPIKKIYQYCIFEVFRICSSLIGYARNIKMQFRPTFFIDLRENFEIVSVKIKVKR